MLNQDKNIRYVALNTLLKVVHADVSSIQRHRGTIIECLKDPDVSIKRRAMELCFALINRSNIVEMIDELIIFLQSCEPEFKADCSSNMFISMEKYAPDKKWHVDQMIRILKSAGNNSRDDIVSSFIILISNTPELHLYAMHQLVEMIRDDVTQQPLVQVASWCLGEYADQFFNGDYHGEQISEEDIANILIKVLNYNAGLMSTRQYAINALIKLTTRFPVLTEHVQTIMSVYGCNMNLDLQQRAVEYNTVLKKYESLREGLFEQMQPFELKQTYVTEEDDYEAANEEDKQQEKERLKQEAAKNLLDIFGEDSSESITTTVPNPPSTNANSLLDIFDAPAVQSTKPSNNQNLIDSIFDSTPAQNVQKTDLLDIFGGISTQPVKPSASSGLDDLLGLGESSLGANKVPSKPAANNADILSMFSAPSAQVNKPVQNGHPQHNGTHQSMVIYEKNELKITIEPSAGGKGSDETQHFVQLKAENMSFSNVIKDFLLSAAAPKTMQLQLSQPDKTHLQPLDNLSQTIAIANPNKVNFKIKLKFNDCRSTD